MEQVHEFFTDTVKLGKKGQITLPKEIRDEDGFEEGDTFIVTHMPGGSITLERAQTKKPEQALFEFLEKMPRIDWRKAWTEVEAERAKEHR